MKRIIALVLLFATAAQAQYFLKQNTASQEMIIGPFVDSTDGNTAETSLSIANTDVKLWKEGATSETNKNSGGATHIADGRYYIVLDATDTNTLGSLEINITMSGALRVQKRCIVLHADVYDALIGASINLKVDVTKFGGNNGTFASGIPSVDAIKVGGQTASAAATVTFPATIASPTNITSASGIQLAANQDVRNVSGDVGGKVLGGGSGTITGIGVWAAGGSGGAILLGSGYTAPPTVSQIRTEMDSNSTKLANLDVVLSTRLAATDYTAPDNSSINNIEALLGSPAGSSVSADIAAMYADIDNIIDARLANFFETATRSELPSLPSMSAPTFAQMWQWNYQRSRFKESSEMSAGSGEIKLFKANGSTVLGTSTTTDDGTTYIRGPHQ